MTLPPPNRRAALTLLLGSGAAIAGAALPAAGQQAPAEPPPASPPDAALPDAGIPRLGDELTPFGAVRAGNRTRAIPAWTGGLAGTPRGMTPGETGDPYIEDVRWFTVRAGDVERYKVRLTAGQRALLEKYPESFEMALFPSHRSAAAPQRLYDASIANAGRARLDRNGLALRDAAIGVPFPIPANGVQALWNHKLRWRGTSQSRTSLSLIPAADGSVWQRRLREDFASPYAAGEGGPAPLLYRRTLLEPKEQAGTTLITQTTLDPVAERQRSWVREGERGRVVRAPDFVYDTPDPATDGLCTADMLDMFSGPLDRFDFTLVSRREMYVPYNAYRLSNPSLPIRNLVWPGHPNPQFLRYEMHRVWIVDARLKPNFRHSLPDRTYYLDEDSWQIVMAEHYNGKGELLRYAEMHGVTRWDVPVFGPGVEFVFDLTTGRYLARGIDIGLPPPVFDAPIVPYDFTPESLVRQGRRG